MRSTAKKTRFIVHSAIIAAMYVALTFIFNYMSFGFVQFRISEALAVLPYFTSSAIPGLFIGCFLSNLLFGGVWADVVFGSIATLSAAVFSYLLRKNKWLVPVPPIVFNTMIIPFVLKYGYGAPEAIYYMVFTVGVSEIIVCGIIGTALLLFLEKFKKFIFN